MKKKTNETLFVSSSFDATAADALVGRARPFLFLRYFAVICSIGFCFWAEVSRDCYPFIVYIVREAWDLYFTFTGCLFCCME